MWTVLCTKVWTHVSMLSEPGEGQVFKALPGYFFLCLAIPACDSGFSGLEVFLWAYFQPSPLCLSLACAFLTISLSNENLLLLALPGDRNRAVWRTAYLMKALLVLLCTYAHIPPGGEVLVSSHLLSLPSEQIHSIGIGAPSPLNPSLLDLFCYEPPALPAFLEGSRLFLASGHAQMKYFLLPSTHPPFSFSPQLLYCIACGGQTMPMHAKALIKLCLLRGPL